MVDIRLTESQCERFETLREELEAQHAGQYASVLDSDVMSYLLDLADETPREQSPSGSDDTEAAASGPKASSKSDTDNKSSEPDAGDRLSAMMNLLTAHEDKWGEASGEERYEVELPDGSVETARTKDDVKAILFRHY